MGVKYYKNENIVFTEIDNEAVLLNQQSGIYYGLDEVGVFVWRHLVDGLAFSDIIQEIVKEYNIEQNMINQVSQDITLFIRDLNERSILLLEK
ncbi:MULTISPECIES: PqqD family protein [Lysinibacillus]|uniref:PqqD family protein n=1 Tax=Lysinibacillus TaxID=400634 RepID=UPI00257B2682|nr:MULTISPECIES: PqqD family protein [Lysinibacillus]